MLVWQDETATAPEPAGFDGSVIVAAPATPTEQRIAARTAPSRKRRPHPVTPAAMPLIDAAATVDDGVRTIAALEPMSPDTSVREKW